jgi:hypothetical protein
LIHTFPGFYPHHSAFYKKRVLIPNRGDVCTGVKLRVCSGVHQQMSGAETIADQFQGDTPLIR